MNKGFTLLEVLIGVFIMVLGIGGVFALVRQNSASAVNIGSKLQASFLAQEGIEITRNIRDTNFLKIHSGQVIAWNAGLTGCQAGCEADYNDASLAANDRFLLLLDNVYSYDSGDETPFKRKVYVAAQGTDALQITSRVSWQEKGIPYDVESSTLLYNWLSPIP